MPRVEELRMDVPGPVLFGLFLYPFVTAAE